jgi:hypothetical protein
MSDYDDALMFTVAVFILPMIAVILAYTFLTEVIIREYWPIVIGVSIYGYMVLTGGIIFLLVDSKS